MLTHSSVQMEVCWELNSHPCYHHDVSFLGLLWQSICWRSSVAKSCPTPWTLTCQTPLSMGFPRQEYRSGLPFPPPGNPPDSGTKPASPALAGGFLTIEPPRKPNKVLGWLNSFIRWYGQTRMNFLGQPDTTNLVTWNDKNLFSSGGQKLEIKVVPAWSSEAEATTSLFASFSGSPMILVGLSWWLGGKEPACNAGDMGWIPGLGRSPEGGHSNPL